ncbi:MAG: GNAT family N-acetyltransferase [Alphaproteobacteria bacterium]
MKRSASLESLEPIYDIEHVNQFRAGDLNDLCDATIAAIKAGGGFGWIEPPEREVLERYWQGVVTIPLRDLLVARIEKVICGACQLFWPGKRNEAQKHHMQITTHFIAPWAREKGIAQKLLSEAEKIARSKSVRVINLDVRETMTDAMRLYEMMGYRRIGEHPAYAQINDTNLKGYYYCKIIDPDLAQSIKEEKASA